MTGPRQRLDQTTDELTLELLRSWREHAPAAGAVERAAAALGVGTAMATPAAAAATGTAEAASAMATAKAAAQPSIALLGKWCVAGFATGMVALGTSHAVTVAVQEAWQPEQGSVREPGGSVEWTPPVRGMAAEPEPPSPPSPARSRETSSPMPRERPAPRLGTAPPHRNDAAAASPTAAAPALAASATPGSRSIGWEIATLDRARRALVARDTDRAMGLLDRLDRDGASGTFGPEATLLRIDALRAAGRGDEARALARRFLARYPASPGADRLRAFLATP